MRPYFIEPLITEESINNEAINLSKVVAITRKSFASIHLIRFFTSKNQSHEWGFTTLRIRENEYYRIMLEYGPGHSPSEPPKEFKKEIRTLPGGSHD